MKTIIKKIFLLTIALILVLWINHTFAEWIKVGVPIDFSSVIDGCWWTKWDYYCNVPRWTSWFQIIMAWIIKYLIFIASIAWVLFIVINWVLYSMAWMSDSLKSDSKSRIIKTLIWIILLIMSWIILNLIAPWVYW